MQLLASFRKWLDTRRRRCTVPFDTTARLTVRKLEERQVLSVTAAIVQGVLDVHVTDANQAVNVSVDGSGHVIVDGTINGNSNQHLVLDATNFSSIHISSDSSANQSVVFDGTQPFHVSGYVTVDGGFSNVAIDGTIQAGGEVTLIANDIALSSTGELTSLSSGIILDATSDIVIDGGSTLQASHQEIQLLANDLVSVGSNASLSDSGGSVVVDAGLNGTLAFSGTVDVSDVASGHVGGTVHMLGEQVTLSETAHLLASGDAAGGTVLIGGGLGGADSSIHNSAETTVGIDVVIDANAITAGNGGLVVVWSNDTTIFQGTINAMGGTLSGNGGYVEISGEQLQVTGFSNLIAPNGMTGTLLLDPGSVEISHGANTGAPPLMDQFTDGYVNSQLGTATLVISTTGSKNNATEDLTVDANAVIVWSNSNSLTLTGTNSVTINGTISNTVGTGSLFINGGSIGINNAIDITAGAVVLNANGAVAEGASGSIAASSLLLSGSGTYTLTNASNDIATLAANTTNTISFQDVNGFDIGNISGTLGINTGGDSAATGHAVTLQTSGTITESQTITASGLELLGSGNFTLTNSNNDVGTLAANTTGTISYYGTSDFAIGQVNSTHGITTTGNVTLQSGGTVSQSQAIATSGLELLSGTYTLTDSSNNISTLAAFNSGGIDFFDANGFAIGQVNSTVGITTLYNVTLQSSGAVTESNAIAASGLELLGSGSYALTVSGNNISTLAANTTNSISFSDAAGFAIGTVNTIGVTTTSTLTLQSSSGGIGVSQKQLISVAGLELLGSGSYLLTNTANRIGTLAANTTNLVNVYDAGNLVIGMVNGTTGITMSSDLSLQTTGSLTFNAATSTTTIVTLNSGGLVTQGAAGSIASSGLLLLGSGAYTLTNSSNDVATLAANTTNTVNYQDANGFDIGTVGGKLGINTGGDSAASGHAVTLQTSGTITESQTITASGLELLGSGNFDLTRPHNDVGILAANTTGAISYYGDSDFAIGQVNSTYGITTTGNVTLQSGGTVTQSQAITASGLELSLGTYTLTDSSNNISTIAAFNSGGINFSDANGFAIGQVNSTVGITTLYNVTLQSSGAVTESNAIAASGLELLGSGSYALTVSGNNISTLAANTTNSISFSDAAGFAIGTVNTIGVTTTSTLTLQSSSGGIGVSQKQLISVAGLELLGSGSYLLTNTANQIGTLAANTTNLVNVYDAGNLIIGMVNGTTGITMSSNLSLQTTGSLTFNAATSTTTIITLDSGGFVTQGAAGSISSSDLLLLGSGAYTLTNSSNDVATLAASTTNTVSYQDANGFDIGSVGGKLGINTGGDSAATGHAVTLQASGTITESQIITASGLELLGSGNFDLTRPHNDVGTLAANTTGSVSYYGNSDFAIGQVNSTYGITTTGNVTLQSGGTVTQSQAITASGLDLLLGTYTLTDSSNNISTLAAFNSGAIDFSDANGFAIGQVNSTVGIATSANVTLQTSGAVTESSAIAASGLELLGSGSYALTVSGNNISTLAANTTNSISFSDANGFTIGTVNTIGVTTTSTLTLQSNGMVSQNQLISVAGLELLGFGTYSLINTSNQIGTLAANTTNTINVHDSSNLIIGMVNGTTGINTGGSNLIVSTGVGAGITINDFVSAGNATFISGKNISLTSTISATGLLSLSAAAGSITGSGTLAANSIHLVAASGINDGAGALSTSAASISANNSGAGNVDIANTFATQTTVTSLTTLGANLTFIQSGGGNLLFTGLITSGNNTGVNGGDIYLANLFAGSTLTIGNTATLSSAGGNGGGLTLSGATLNPNSPPIFGAGNITIIGGQEDTVVNSDLIINGSINIFALRDVIIGATVSTTNNPLANITVTGDSDGDGVGGVELLSTGRIVSAKDVTISGSDLFATSTGAPDGFLMLSSCLKDQLLAVGTITIFSNSAAPANSQVILNGQIHSTGGDVNVSSNSAILIGSTITSDTGNIQFNDAVDLTANIQVQAGGDVLFKSTVDGDSTANNRILLVNANGLTTFDGAIGTNGVLANLTTKSTGTTDLNGGAINATTVDFQDVVILTANTTINGTTVTFEKTINGDSTANARTLLVNATATTFDGVIGNSGLLASLTTDAAGTTYLNATTINATTIDFKDAVILNSNTTITGMSVTFENTVDGDLTANNRTLLVTSSGTTTFGGAIGSNGILANLTTDAAGTTDLNCGTISAMTVDFQDAIVLTANMTITGTTVTFAKTIDGDSTANNRTLLVNVSGTTAFDGPIGSTGVLASLATTAAGTTDLNGGTVSATSIDFQNAVVLTANTTVTGMTITFEKTVDGDSTANNRTLLVNASGTTTFDGVVGSNGVLASLTTNVGGTTYLKTPTIIATTVDFKDAVILNANTTITGTTITFDNSIDGDLTANNRTLILNASGTTTFEGAIGNNGILASLTTDAAGTTDLNGGTIRATTVDFQDAVVLTANSIITGTTVTFAKTVDGDSSVNNRTLLVNASGTTAFDGALGTGGVLASLTTSSTGTTDLNGSTINATVIDFQDAVVLTANTTITGTTVTFEKTVDGDSTANNRTLLVNATGATTFDGAVGNNGILANLTTDVAGTTDLNGGKISATAVDFKDAIVLGANTTVNGTTVTFEKTVDGDTTANNRTLLVNAIGTTTFDGAVGTSGVLANLTTGATGTTDLNGGTANATTIDFKNRVILTANATIAGTTITFENTVDGDSTANGRNLLVNANGTTTFDGAIGGAGELAGLTIHQATDVSFHGSSATIHATELSITNTGSATFDGKTTIDDAMFVQSGGDVTVNAAMTATGLNTAINLQAGSGTGNGNVTVTSSGSLSSTAIGSDIQIQAGSLSGNIQLVGAASNITANDNLALTASNGSITGLGTLSATSIQLVAATGIYDGSAANGALHTNATTISADNSQAFAVNISNMDASATTVTSLTTVGANLTFTQSGGGDLTFTGAITSGSATVNGGNILLQNTTTGSALTIASTAILSSAAGSGGGLTISGATVEATTPPVLGAGNISVIGGSLDTIVTSDLTVGGKVNISALRDIIIGAVVQTTNNAGISLIADSDVDGVGGVEILANGQISSAMDVTIRGSDLFATSGGVPDSVRILSGGVGDRILAVGNINISSNAVASPAAVVVLDGPIQSTGGDITLSAKSMLQINSTITADAGNVDFQSAVDLTGSMFVSARGNVTFESTVNGDASANSRTLTVNALGTTTFDNAVGNSGILSALTVQQSSDVAFHSSLATLNVTELSITNTGTTTFDGTATINDSLTVQSGGNVVVNSAITAAGSNTAIDLRAGSVTNSGSVMLTTQGSLLTTAAGSGINVLAGTAAGDIVLSGASSNITAVNGITIAAASGSITGLGTLTANTIQLSAATGINDGTAIQGGLKTDAAQISADNSRAFAVNLSNFHASDTTVASLTTVGGNLTFVQAGGGDLTFIGAITSGNNSVDGGNIDLEDPVLGTNLTIASSAILSTAAGFGGGLTISGATLDPSHPPIFGQGSITIIGGAPDTIINSDLSLNGTINIAAMRDVIIEALIRTSSNLNASINLKADTDGDGVGGVEILATGRLDSNKDISIYGSDVDATVTSTIYPPDSVLIIGNGASDQIIAMGNITVASNSWAPSNAIVILDGQMTATTGTIFISAASSIRLGADLTVGTTLSFGQNVLLTSSVTLTSTGGGDITFERALSDGGSSTLTSNTIGNLYFQGNTTFTTLNAKVQPNNITFGLLGGPAVTDVITDFAGFQNLGTVTIGLNSGDNITFKAGVTHIVGNTNITGTLTTNTGAVTFGVVSLNGTVETDGQVVSVLATTLSGNSSITTNLGGSTSGADVTFGTTLDSASPGMQALTLNAGTGGNITFVGAVGGSSRTGDLVVLDAKNVLGTVGITATSFVQSAGTGATTLNGALNTNSSIGVHFTTNAINVNNTVTTTGAGGVEFTNAGQLTINGNISSDGAVTQDGAGLVTITTPGTRAITTTGDAVTFHSATTLNGSGGVLSIDTTSSSNPSGANVTFVSTLDATSTANPEKLLINCGTAGDLLFSGSVGNSSSLGAIVITDAHNFTESSGINAASLLQVTGTGLTEFNGIVQTSASAGITLSNGAITINNTTSATESIILTTLSQHGNITIDSTLQTTQGGGTVSLTTPQGAIVNGAAANVINVIADSLVMRTVEGIGSTGSALQTQVSTMSAVNAGSGNIQVDNLSSQLLTIGAIGGVNGISNVGPGLGDIVITNNASILVSAFSSPTNAPIMNRTGGNITLMTKGGAYDITVNSPLSATGGNGNITLQSGSNVVINDTGVTDDISVVGMGTVYLNAANSVLLGGQNANTTSDNTQFTVQNDVLIQTATGSITNTLPLVYNIQSPQMTATGFVFVNMNVGRPGETNITVTVYWGDGTSTVQVFPTKGNYTFVHQYHGNPDKSDQSNPILVNFQVAHDEHVVIKAQNVDTPTESVTNIGLADPPPVPSQNINADLSAAIYDSLNSNFAALHDQPLNDKILQAEGTLDAPGNVIFQDTSIRAMVITVPGEGLSIFPFDTTPPVVYLHFPDRIILPEIHEHAAAAIVQSDSSRLELASTEDATLTERVVILEIYEADAVERVELSEDVLDDLFRVIGKLPDGKYRFLLQEPGETRQRVLLELFEVRQGKIFDKNESGDRPPSSMKRGIPIEGGDIRPDQMDAPVDADEAARNAEPDMPSIEHHSADPFVRFDQKSPANSSIDDEDGESMRSNHWNSAIGRRAWQNGERSYDESRARAATLNDQPDTLESNSTVPSQSNALMSAGAWLKSGARLFRKYAFSAD